MKDAEIEAARFLLARLGISPEQLLDEPVRNRPMPTFSQYISSVSDAVPSGSRHAYEPYWRRVEEVWGERGIDEPTPLEVEQLAEQVKLHVVVRKNSRGGRSAAEHLIAALRCLYRHAVADELISEADNPAARVAKPRRLASTRRALPDARLVELNEVAGSTGNDPELDSLLLRLHTETACRRGGALALRPCDLDSEQCLVRLREKGETVRWQPVSGTLMKHLVIHAEERGSRPGEQLLRYRNGRPITARRYDHLWARLGKHLPWVATQQISTHWLRHTTLTWVERSFGYAVARAFAGHNGKSDAGSTSTYIRADLQEVALALSVLTGEQHPLAMSAEVHRWGSPLLRNV
ncbi:site-specific integrase [Solihabitans fulvus]|uniref:Site-specific integrase n=1 Tax=Solihabitans fulvus TaxID=1892852 RepID=A0A5B2XCN2_9PSEU|nr:site-specific integrase [Solihabitans fulvus]KAA2261518.1 site-specific integrase [Solihabitans fulvus]